MVRTRRTTTRSWADGSEAVRTAARQPDSLLGRLRRWWSKRDTPTSEFRIGDRVRIITASPQFKDRIGTEATIVSELERAGDGRTFYRLDNNTSAEPDCLTLLERAAVPRDGTT